MKGFYYDALLDEENICNLNRERSALQRGVDSGRKMVVYGPRNFGKTSLVKNVIIPGFQRRHKKNFVLFADLMEVKNLESINQRIQLGFEKSFSASFPKRNLLEAAKKILSRLRPEITMDPLTGNPSLTLGIHKGGTNLPFSEIFAIVRERIVPHMPVLIVFDEFQDIAFVPEAQGLFRQELQQMQKASVILMGSKHHIMANLFAKPGAPLASFGEDVEFGSIPYEEYFLYIRERFKGRKLAIEFDTAKKLQDALFRVPEAINIICAGIYENFHHKTIGGTDILSAIDHVVASRQSRFEEWLAHFSEKEEEILVALAKNGPVKHPNSRSFLKTISATQRTVGLTFSNFLDNSIVEKIDEGYRVADPLLFYFLKRFR